MLGDTNAQQVSGTNQPSCPAQLSAADTGTGGETKQFKCTNSDNYVSELASRINNITDNSETNMTIQEGIGKSMVRLIDCARQAEQPDNAIHDDYLKGSGVEIKRTMEGQIGDDQGFGNKVNDQASSRQVAQIHLSLSDIDLGLVQQNNIYLKSIFDRVASTNQPNHATARIRLPSGLNIPRWRSDLAGYHDYKIVDYLEYGWQMVSIRTPYSSRSTLTICPQPHTRVTCHTT